MREAVEKDREMILQYFMGGIQDCIYPYIDIRNYGVASGNMKVWLEEENGNLCLVAMKYYDSFWIYTHKKEGDMRETANLLGQNPTAMISGRKDIIEKLFPLCGGYRASYGAVFLMNRFRKTDNVPNLFQASPRDAEEIAELICSDAEIGRHYTVKGLSEQLKERMETGTGRSWCIREKGKIVAHSATYAEAEELAVVGGTIVKPEYRSSNYYFLLSNFVLGELAAEQKSAYTFSMSEKMLRYHRMLHTQCGEYGKLER